MSEGPFIGWTGKIRYRLMRGAKSRPSLLDFLYLNALHREQKLAGKTTFQWATLVA